MSLQKQSFSLNFAQGLETKTDPKQVPLGKFLSLENSIFSTTNLLQKRSGFPELSSLGSSDYQFLTTFNGNLTAVGSSLAAYSAANATWVTKAAIKPIRLEAKAVLRTSSNQSQCDSAVASNGLVCTVYTNTSPSTTYNYVISEFETGQVIVGPIAISSPSESPRVFLLGNYFVVLYTQSANMKYVAIPITDPSNPIAAVTLVTNYAAGGTELAFDGVIFNNNLYIAYNASDGGGAIRMTYLNSFLVRQTANTGTNVANTASATMVSICADSTSSIIWVAFYKTAGTTGSVVAVDAQLNIQLAATQIISAGTILNITCTATSGIVTVFYEVSTAYSYGATLPTNIINERTCTIAGVLGTATTIRRSVGLASKAFLIDGVSYMLSAYSSAYQPSFFLINGSGAIVAKLAYANGNGYLTLGLPSVSVIDTVASIAYLIKDLILPTNKSQSPTSTTPVFTQAGVNLASFDFTVDGMTTSEIGGNLHLSGGMLYAYDGAALVEQGFHLYPDNVVVTTSTSGGSLKDQTYYYQATYEWTDNQGNIHRSAPSLAVKQVTTGGNASTNTIKIPTLRLTAKSLVKIVLYRWSTDNQTYYQVTSLTSPFLNSTTTDSVTIPDTFADADIVGNSILYTTGGVVENIGPPATDVSTLYKSRLFLIDAEDKNLLWYSKQVIEATPVEMSDLFTLYVAPSLGAQGDTGKLTALSAMDDKLILFKKDAIYYLVGEGPDNTGANNDFSEPVFITSTVGCANPRSIVFMPQGLMFQSDKGIWLLQRDLSTVYIGAPVQAYNDDEVLSAIAIPGTNEVRFTLESGTTLMFDYFQGQWESFKGIPGLSSTLYEDKHTFINRYGRVLQQSASSYLDGSNPVLMGFETSWIQAAGFQGFERGFYFFLNGTYKSPHKLVISVAYDYEDVDVQSKVISPTNYTAAYGSDPLYGSSATYGGSLQLEQWRVYLERQKCQAFKIKVQEVFDSSFATIAGEGLQLSGITFVVGVMGSYPRLPAAQSVG